jgi:hypothetical protein
VRRARAQKIIGLGSLLVACGAPALPAARPSAHARASASHAPAQSTPGSYWQEVPFDVASADADPRRAPPPVDVARIVTPALQPRFDALSKDARSRLLQHAVVVERRSDHASSLGASYGELRSGRVPFVITLDALFAITFGALDRALGDADHEVVEPALATMLARMQTRLGAELRAARSDTAAAYALAQTIVGVAQRLLDPTVEWTPAVAARGAPELELVLAHAGPARSTLLGVTLDYAAFDAQAGLAGTDGRVGGFRAITWLEQARLALAAHRATGVDETQARTQTRAAMLLTRALGDREAAQLYQRIDEVGSFVAGVADDAGPGALLRAAAEAHVDLRREDDLANVVTVDRLRRTLAAAPNFVQAAGPVFRLFGPSAPADARALFVLARAESVPSLPSGLGVALALGAPGARTLLAVDEASTRAADLCAHVMPPSADVAARHATLYASALDAIAAYAAPSAGDVPWLDAEARQRLVLEGVLSAWTELRHANVPFAHASARALMDDAIVPSADPAPGAVEPHPEAIARLLALVRQAATGLAAHHALHEGGAAAQLLEHVDRLLGDALRIAVAQARGLGPDDARVIDEMPARLAAIERRMGKGAAAPAIVAVHQEPATSRALEEATGDLEDVWMVVDIAGAPTLAVGAHVPHFELGSTLRSTDGAWARRLREAPPPRPTWLEPDQP